MSAPKGDVPTLAEWAGGDAVFGKLTKRFYEKVPDDPVLEPVFRNMNPDHAHHVSQFVAEVFGGAKSYSENGGSHADMVSHHLGRHLTEAQRRRWLALMLETADEVGLPDDPEFRSALVGYLEWGTRIAVINSRDGVTAPPPGTPMPCWDWGATGGPYRGD
ncbi:group II truncated hemoglobin [Roseiarcaceae bacterium H3SJ34-1]|uniref:group II truncated hemoglobin n=1 Tax=Terripilifer ovatus TaxID=3032367 RepID=UPI003AB92500|nr:group II truncated hemoglobin [Roseiarcaceae bacterium H3SJ34-1]